MLYEKPWLGLADQVTQLRNRGLQIPDDQLAIAGLRAIGYYRLAPYCLAFKDPATRRFHAGTTFDAVVNLYNFDRDLRLVVLEAIAHIEIALRADLVHELARIFGPFGHTDPSNFPASFNHTDLMDALADAEAKSPNEKFVQHFRTKYNTERHLPVWMAAELTSFGTLSRLYAEGPAAIRRSFATHLSTASTFIESWMRSLSYVRNVCAHHNRLWNRSLRLSPAIPPKSRTWLYDVARGTDRLYPVLVVTQHCSQRVSPTYAWKDRIFALFDAYPTVPLAPMGIPTTWRTVAPWV